jgi:hypothetical protein
MSRVPLGAGIRLYHVVAALPILLLVPLDYLWFRMLGRIGG